MRWRLAWQSLLVAGPLLALAALGIYFLRQDKGLVEAEARERAEQAASAAVKNLAGFLPRPEAGWKENTSDWPPGRIYFETDPEGALVFPPPMSGPPETDAPAGLDRAGLELWIEAQAAEFERGDMAEALRLWEELLARDLPEGARARARFARAVVMERLGRDATAEFEELLEAPAGRRGAAGLPIGYLAAWKLLERAPAEEGRERAEKIAGVFLEAPTEHSRAFLERGARELSDWAAVFHENLEAFKRHELARELHAAAVEAGIMPSAGWIAQAGGEEWLVLHRDGFYEALRGAEAERLASAALESVEAPPHFGLELRWEGHSLGHKGGEGELLAAASDAGLPGLTAHAYLADRGALFERQRQRAILLGGLIGLSTLAAAAGLFSGIRAEIQQRHLDEMKTNFVSSVSHELRAPLASMRLLSEGLESGRVAAGPKQREYFGFLVQECRRLSLLVENVLNFTRIEQNRRVFEFEEADLAKVAASAMRTMEPAAARERVRLELTPDSGSAAFIVRGDALALQQAVINLLDNAIKHSPPGETVRVTLSQHDEVCEVVVADGGAGIPVAEQRRIFDRFYRLGSELRRETAGVGIGLSIVKHTVEAHGGGVTIESGSDGGSTFRMRLPAAPGEGNGGAP